MNKIEEIYYDLPLFLQGLILAIVAILAGLIIKTIIFNALRLYSQKKNEDTILVGPIYKRLNTVATFLFPLIGLMVILPLLKLTEKQFLYLEGTLEITLKICIAWLLIKIVWVVQDVIYDRFSIEQSDNFLARKVQTQVQFIRKLLIIAIVILFTSIILLSFESVKNIGAGLLTSAGVTGVIIGFAAQKSIANLIAGLQIAFTQPIKIDDVVIIEGEFGRVEEITLTYVVIRIWDKRRLVVPINYFIENPFQNWTRRTAELLGTVFLYVDYHIPFEVLRKETLRLLEANPMWNGEAWGLQVVDSTERSVQLRVIVSASDAGNSWDLRVYLREKLIEFIRENYPESLPRTRAVLEEKEISPTKSTSHQKKDSNGQ